MASADITAAAETAAPRIRIRPPRRWQGLGLRTLTEYHELIYFLTKRELQLRLQAEPVRDRRGRSSSRWRSRFVFALFFGQVANIGSEGFPYPVFAIVGLVPWLFTSQAVGQSAGSLVLDANLVAKVYFPRLALPISKALGLMWTWESRWSWCSRFGCLRRRRLAAWPAWSRCL